MSPFTLYRLQTRLFSNFSLSRPKIFIQIYFIFINKEVTLVIIHASEARKAKRLLTYALEMLDSSAILQGTKTLK